MFEDLSIGYLFGIELSSPLGWLLTFGVAFGFSLIAKVILKLVEIRIRTITKNIKGNFDDVIVADIASTKTWALFIWALYPLVQLMDGQDGAKKIVHALFIIFTAAQIAIWGLIAIRVWREDVLRKKIGTDASSVSAISLMSTTLQGIFIVALVLICLSNLGVDIAALIAGLGVGGIAVALAAQNILGDIFGSLSIVLDKPFVVGDFIVVGNDMGTVENIGVKTTRVRSLSGEELIFANKDLLDSRIKNFKRMRQRRVVLNFGVTYDTPLEKLRQIPTWVQSFITTKDLLTFERSHLFQYGDSSLNFETIYWVKDPDHGKHMDLQQNLMLELMEKFKTESINFAFPSRTIYMQTPESAEQKNNDDKPNIMSAEASVGLN